jgi:predicted metal-dependent peptidase
MTDPALLLAAGRAVAGEKLPYLRTGLFAMVPVITPEVPAGAVDERWRLYVNPGFLLGLTAEEVAGVWLHEFGHVMHRHGERWRQLLEPDGNHPLFNAGGDAAVNEMLHDGGVTVPAPKDYGRDHIRGAHRGMTAEQLYLLLRDRPGGAADLPDDCGSGASGGRRPWERDDPADPGGPADGSVGEGRAELLRRQVAKEISAHQRAAGTVPAGWLRLADEILTPRVDWRRELRSVVGRTEAMVAGMRDYTFSRLSRRAAATPGIVLPALRQPRPARVDIVIDTSGSMSDRMLSQVKTEIRTIIRGTHDAVRVFSCDAVSTGGHQVRRVEDLRLRGGGGTDIRQGLHASAAQHAKADIVIVATDGDTPWDPHPPPGNPRARYVALLLDGDRDDVPAFLHKILVNTD